MFSSLKLKVYDILVETDDGDLIDRIVAVFLMILIIINSLAVVLETVAELNEKYHSIFQSIELISIIIFTIEYILRVWISNLTPQFSKSFVGRIRYIFSLMALVDLIAILPFYLPFIFPFDLRILRVLRVFRLFRLFKMSRYVQALNTLDDVIRSKKEELIVIVVMIFILLLFSSSLIYLVESEAQPDKFPDIPSAMWWGVATLTTVGYGDIYPVTPLGKIFSGFIAFLGIGLFALPTGILASGFAEQINLRKIKKECSCPHCGSDISSVVTGK